MRTRLFALLLLVVILLPNSSVGSAQAQSGAHWHSARAWVTGYVATGDRTSDGSVPHWGTAASDPSTIPTHTYVTIVGLETVWTNDTGGAVWGYHLDVFCTSVWEAYHITGYYLIRWRS